MSHLNIAFDRYACIGTVMHYVLEISILINSSAKVRQLHCINIVESEEVAMFCKI